MRALSAAGGEHEKQQSLFSNFQFIFFFLSNFQCSLCENSFCQQANLERHIRKHQDSYTNPNILMENNSEEDEDLTVVDLETV